VFADLGLDRRDREIDVESGGRPRDPALGVTRKGGVVRSLGLGIERGQWTVTQTATWRCGDIH